MNNEHHGEGGAEDHKHHHHHEVSIEIILDGHKRISHHKRRDGLQIRELGPADRVEGFETQEIDKKGKKIKTIADHEEVELHHDERFRTVPNHGGPGASA